MSIPVSVLICIYKYVCKTIWYKIHSAFTFFNTSRIIFKYNALITLLHSHMHNQQSWELLESFHTCILKTCYFSTYCHTNTCLKLLPISTYALEVKSHWLEAVCTGSIAMALQHLSVD